MWIPWKYLWIRTVALATLEGDEGTELGTRVSSFFEEM